MASTSSGWPGKPCVEGGFSGSDVFVSNYDFPTLGNCDGPASASSGLSGRETDPPLGCAVFFDVEVFLPVEKDVYAAFKFRCIVELASPIYSSG